MRSKADRKKAKRAEIEGQAWEDQSVTVLQRWQQEQKKLIAEDTGEHSSDRPRKRRKDDPSALPTHKRFSDQDPESHQRSKNPVKNEASKHQPSQGRTKQKADISVTSGSESHLFSPSSALRQVYLLPWLLPRPLRTTIGILDLMNSEACTELLAQAYLAYQTSFRCSPQSNEKTGPVGSSSKSGSKTVPPPNAQTSRRYEYIPINLRPITHVWAKEYLKVLNQCSPGELFGWFNVRAVSSGTGSSASPEDVVKIFKTHLIHLTDVITLDLGWAKGEWMVRIIGEDRLQSLSKKECYANGVLLGDVESGGFDYLISRLPTVEELQADATKFPIPVVLMGIPYYFNPNIALDQYLCEAIQAQNKHFGIQAVVVQQRYKIGPTRTNDMRCHLMLDSRCLPKWEFDRPMRLTVQGWDNEGVPMPEMWPVTMRHIDECVRCGGYYHQINKTGALQPCEVIQTLESLAKLQTMTAEPGEASIIAESVAGSVDPVRVEMFRGDKKTRIGFLLA